MEAGRTVPGTEGPEDAVRCPGNSRRRTGGTWREVERQVQGRRRWRTIAWQYECTFAWGCVAIPVERGCSMDSRGPKRRGKRWQKDGWY